MIKRCLVYSPLILACLFAAALALPTIASNVSDPQMISYRNCDEGGHMSLMWWYYSGEKLPAFRWDYDYGLEVLYLTDMGRLVLSGFIPLTPGSFVLMMRWLHFIAWLLALVALWYFVGYHFGRRWQQILAVFLLCVRPAFAYLLLNMKPEPLTLLFLILGLHYALRIVKEPRYYNVCMAIAFAALTFIVKFFGLFLLPTVVAAMYCAGLYRQRTGTPDSKVFPCFRFSWTLPLVTGLFTLGLVSSVLMVYVRKSTGMTWYAQYGYLGGLLHNKNMLILFLGSATLILASPTLWAFKRFSSGIAKKITDIFLKVSSYGMVVVPLFMAFVLLFGFRWLVSPKYFISTYSQIAGTVSSTVPHAATLFGLWHAFVLHIINAAKALDPFICALFACYVAIELFFMRENIAREPVLFFKRMVLATFLFIPILYIASMMRMFQHHMLPFFVVMSVLAMEGLRIILERYTGRRVVKNVIVLFMALLFAGSIIMNGRDTVMARMPELHQQEDIVHEIAHWWRANYPPDTSIVADYPAYVYIPPEFKNVKYFRGYQQDRAEQLKQLVRTHHPQLVYYNEGGTEPMPALDRVLPDSDIRLIKVFDNRGRRFQAKPDSRFVIYEVR